MYPIRQMPDHLVMMRLTIVQRSGVNLEQKLQRGTEIEPFLSRAPRFQPTLEGLQLFHAPVTDPMPDTWPVEGHGHGHSRRAFRDSSNASIILFVSNSPDGANETSGALMSYCSVCTTISIVNYSFHHTICFHSFVLAPRLNSAPPCHSINSTTHLSSPTHHPINDSYPILRECY
jgi:hypothetical protein